MSSPESIFASWAAGASSTDPAELEPLLRAHPEHATALRDLHASWQRERLAEDPLGRPADAGHRGLNTGIDLPGSDAGDFTVGLVTRLTDRGPRSTRYRLGDELGRGGMGTVLSVWDEDLRRRLAMKILHEQGKPLDPSSGDRRTLARLLEEAQVTAQLDHPGIVPVHELGVDEDGGVFFTMKLVRGQTLASVFAELAAGAGGWTRTRVLGLLVKVCEAMSYAHAKGVIHRDLKPANVMVGKFGEVYVMDWGLAKILGREDGRDVRLRDAPGMTTSELRSDRHDHASQTPDSPLYTMDGDVVGTPAYMSPEQATGRVSEMGPPTDVYALGSMLYHLLAGHLPYVPPGAVLNNYAVWQRVQEGPPRPLDEFATDAPPELVAICERAMARDAGARYPDMGALAEDLSAFVEGRVVRAYETGAWAEARKWVQRNRGLAVAMAAAAVLLVTGLAGALVLRQKAQDSYVLAEQRREDLEVERSSLAAEVAAVKRLSALQDHEELLSRADALWPPHPDRITDYQEWIEEARALAVDLPTHRAKLDELEALALPRSNAEREVDLIQHPGYSRLESLTTQAGVLRSALAQRREGVGAAPAELDWSRMPASANGLNDLAWSLVDPERETFGREAEGVALAERALAMANETGEGELVALVGDTLARGLFALGRDAEARAASAAAVEAAPAEQREEFAGFLAEIERGIAYSNSAAGLTEAAATLEDLEAQAAALARSLRETLPVRFPDTEPGREARWWHLNLTKLIGALEDLQDEEAGLLSEDGISPEHGWSVPRRLRFAERLRDEAAAGGAWESSWAEASAAIGDDPRYGGLQLAPQVGLVPIGQDPRSGLWEFWHVASGARPLRGDDGALLRAEDMGVVLVLIPAGSFWMGASMDDSAPHNFDPLAELDEGPVHEVQVSAYFLSKYELTQAQWIRFAGRNPSSYQPPRDVVTSLLHPVEQISWLDATRELGRMGLALPTEAQWENGCRAGTSTPWHFGDDREDLRGRVNLADRTAAEAGVTWPSVEDWPDNEDGGVVHMEAGHYPPNAAGLHEVHGNLWEWCQDEYDGDFYERSPERDPVATTEDQAYRVARGGGFSNAVGSTRSAIRIYGTPTLTNFDLGVRPARPVLD